MTDIIREAREAGEGRTPGPWADSGSPDTNPAKRDVVAHRKGGMGVVVADMRSADCESADDIVKLRAADAQFIAFADNHWDTILDQLESALARVEELEERAHHWRQDAVARLEAYLTFLRLPEPTLYGTHAHIRANLILPTLAMLGADSDGEYDEYDEVDEQGIIARTRAALEDNQ